MPNLTGHNPNQLPAGIFLGELAFVNFADLVRERLRVEMSFAGTGSQVSHIICRPYPYTLAIVNAQGSSVSTLPTANADGSYTAGQNYTLLHNAPVGTHLTIEIIPIIS